MRYKIWDTTKVTNQETQNMIQYMTTELFQHMVVWKESVNGNSGKKGKKNEKKKKNTTQDKTYKAHHNDFLVFWMEA